MNVAINSPPPYRWGVTQRLMTSYGPWKHIFLIGPTEKCSKTSTYMASTVQLNLSHVSGVLKPSRGLTNSLNKWMQTSAKPARSYPAKPLKLMHPNLGDKSHCPTVPLSP